MRLFHWFSNTFVTDLQIAWPFSVTMIFQLERFSQVTLFGDLGINMAGPVLFKNLLLFFFLSLSRTEFGLGFVDEARKFCLGKRRKCETSCFFTSWDRARMLLYKIAFPLEINIEKKGRRSFFLLHTIMNQFLRKKISSEVCTVLENH